jgi:hypothetical protein
MTNTTELAIGKYTRFIKVERKKDMKMFLYYPRTRLGNPRKIILSKKIAYGIAIAFPTLLFTFQICRLVCSPNLEGFENWKSLNLFSRIHHTSDEQYRIRPFVVDSKEERAVQLQLDDLYRH